MPAIVMLDMATQGRCAAITNIRKGFLLPRGEDVTPASQKIVFMCAENIGHFEPMIVHGSDRNVLAALTMSSGSNNSSGLTVERVAVLSDMQVASGGPQFRMAEQNLNAAEIHASFQQVSSKGVAERMWMNRLGDAG